MAHNMNILDRTIGHQQPMFKIEILPFLRCAVECLLNAGSVVWMSSVDHELHCRLIGSVAVKDTKGFLRPVEFSARNIPTETARVAQPLRFSQKGFTALQFGGPFRHLRLEFVAGFTKLLLALAYRFLGACRTKCGSSMIGGHGEQHLVNFSRKVGAITRRRNQTPLGIDANGDDNTAALLRATANVANDFAVRQAAVDSEMVPQPFRECWPGASPCNFDRGAHARITQTHKGEVEVQ